jgi:putative flippase GtrA
MPDLLTSNEEMKSPRIRGVHRQLPAFAETHHEFGRYLVVGGCGYVLALSLYAAQIAAGVTPFAAVPLAFVANGLFNFFVNRRWSFAPSLRSLGSELSRFGIVAIASLAVNYTMLYLLHEIAGITPVLAQAMAITVATPVGFAGNKLWSFSGS